MRKTKIIGFSVPPEIYQKIENLARNKHKTKSEFFREIVETYLQSIRTVVKSDQQPDKSLFSEKDLAFLLRSYWEAKTASPLKIIIVGLGIVVKKNKVLIGARKEKDPWVENLTWVFPGGKIKSLDFEKEIKKEVGKETGLKVKVKDLVAARIHPDSGFKPIQIVALYFHCQPINHRRPKPGGDLVKLKWVRPTAVFRYFTTSTCDEVTKFLTTIEKSN